MKILQVEMCVKANIGKVILYVLGFKVKYLDLNLSSLAC